MLSAAFLEQLTRFLFAEARIARFDHKKEPIVGGALEALPVEHRMVPARQKIHAKHREESGESGKQNRQFEHDREERGYSEKIGRLSVNIERVKQGRRSELHNRGCEQTGNATAKNEGAQPGF